MNDEDCYLIAHLWVAPEERRQGKGRAMVRDAIKEMKAERKHDTIKLSADSSLEDPDDPIDLADLVDFYESEGFELEYAGDVVIMSMSI